MWRRRTALRRLSGIDRSKALAFLARDPVNAVLARANIEAGGRTSLNAIGLFSGFDRDLQSLAWDGGNIIPLGFDDDGLDQLADFVAGQPRRCSSLVGPADQVIGLWSRVEDEWGPAREERLRQYSMTIVGDLLVRSDPTVRPALPGDIDLVFPAAVSMFSEEVGYDPTIYGSSYRRRAESLIKDGLTYVKMGPDPRGGERVIFKADVGALAGGVAQIQGVWTAPDVRGQGIGTAAIAAVVEQVRQTHAPVVSLYVNDYNIPAVLMYQHVGFRAVGEWATILL